MCENNKIVIRDTLCNRNGSGSRFRLALHSYNNIDLFGGFPTFTRPGTSDFRENSKSYTIKFK